MSLEDRKDIQPKNLAWSIYMQSLKSASYLFLEGNNKGYEMNTNAVFIHFNEYETKHFD